MKRIIFPTKSVGCGISSKGTKRAATKSAAMLTRGVTRIIQDEFSE